MNRQVETQIVYRRRGAIVVFTAISMVTLLAITALAVDLGNLYAIKAQLQKAADGGSLAGAALLHGETGMQPEAAKLEALKYVAKDLRISEAEAGSMAEVTIGRIVNPLDYHSEFVPGENDEANAVRVTVHRDQAHENPVALFFAPIFGQHYSDVSVKAIAGLQPPHSIEVVPICLRTPDFGPVDPAISDANPGKDGPSWPSDAAAFRVGEKVTVYAFGTGPRQPVHLVLDLPQYEGAAETNSMLEDRVKGDLPPLQLAIGDEMPIWNEGSGDGKFGQKLLDRMSDGITWNDTIIMPVIETLPDTRDDAGRLAGDIRIVDFVAVHLDGVETVQIPDPDHPSKTLDIDLIVGTVKTVAVNAEGGSSPGGYADGLFALQLLR